VLLESVLSGAGSFGGLVIFAFLLAEVFGSYIEEFVV